MRRNRIVGFGSFGDEAGYNKTEGEIPPQAPPSGGPGYVPFYPTTGGGQALPAGAGIAGAILLAGVAGFVVWSLITG